jgi:N-acetylmuramic acid 6-phosphate etherase
MTDLAVRSPDVVVGIAAGSTTPYAIGALREARRRGARTVLLACVPRQDIEVAGEVDLVIAPLTGPEVIAGSTRMKAGTATKLVLNMLTTTAMVRIGKTYGNLMVDLRIGSEKLADRGRRIVRDLLGVPEVEAQRLLDAAGGRVKTALVMGRRRVGRAEAERLLDAAGGFLRRAWEEA